MTSSIILFQYYKVLESETDLLESKIRSNAVSAINYITASDNLQAPYNSSIDLFDRNNDSVEVRIEKWGVLDLVTTTAHCGRKSFTKVAFIGDEINAQSSPAIYLADNSTALSLAGKTVIKGDAILPKAGAKKAYIEGQDFNGSKLIEGVISPSKTMLPAVLPNILKNIEVLVYHDSTSANETLTDVERYIPFDNKTTVISTDQAITLDNRLEGRIVIASRQSIFIRRTAVLKNVLLYAPYIQIESGFEGIAQLFAKDSITIADGVALKYPSVVAVVKKEEHIDYPKITIGKKAKIAGLVMIENGYDAVNKTINLKVGKGAVLTGIVYCDGIISLDGPIWGSLYTMGIMLITPSATYENHLLNATIDITKVPAGFALRSFSNVKPTRKVISWL
jgi:hypothetical protein